MKMKIKFLVIQMIPLLLFLTAWEFCVRGNRELVFYFGMPSKIWHYIVIKFSDGSLVNDFMSTLSEAFLGFLLGNITGTVIGMSLWFSKFLFRISKPYIIAMGTAPIFALAPLIIIWFGTGIVSKIYIAALSTVFIALFQAYNGAADIDKNYIKLMRSMKASKITTFRKVIAPSSIVWVMSAFKINIGFALLGAFIGEYISSSQGLGHLILVASGLFDISLVLVGVLMLIIIALILNYVISECEIPIRRLIVKYL